MPLPFLNLKTASRSDVLDYVTEGWQITERLFSSLASDDTLFMVPDKLRHPLIFYFCHPATFFVNKMIEVGILTDSERINPYFEEIFAIGVDEMSWDDYSRAPMEWPDAHSVREYRATVLALLKDRILNTDFSSPISWEQPFWAFVMGAEHERIHIETSSVLFRQLPLEELKRPADWPAYAPLDNDHEVVNEFVDVPDCTVELGKPHGHHAYGWDGEFGKRVVSVPAFAATKFLITNSEFLEFVNAGGYRDSKYWSNEGWSWRSFIKAEYPRFWKRDGDIWKYRALFDDTEMPWNWPVEVNYLEASAFCAWKGGEYRCITEAEWKVILGDPPAEFAGLPTSDAIIRENAAEYHNFNLSFGSSTSVDKYPPSSMGFYDVHGNVWEWTEDEADALPGFKIHDAYFDFSAPCFDGLHNVILGGSWISIGDEASDFSRYWFRRHFYQHCGFRLVKQLDPVTPNLHPICDNPHRIGTNRWRDGSDPYEQQETTASYLLYAYATTPETLPFSLGPINDYIQNFPKACAELVMDNCSADGSALDLGCGVGRSTFELARQFNSVHGVEYSREFVRICNQLRDKGSMEYTYVKEGSTRGGSTAEVDAAIDRTRVSFSHGDATNLPDTIGVYDAVLLANLLDRVREPLKMVDRLPSLVHPGGTVVVTSPYTWMEAFTPKPRWLGGHADGELSTFEALKEVMCENFELVQESSIPMLIREHQRKYQLCVPHCSVWRKKL